MDEKSTGVDLPRPGRLEREIGEHRSQVRALVGELDRRRRDRLNPSTQLRENGLYYGAGAFFLFLGSAFSLYFARRVRRLRRLRALRRSWPYRFRVAASRWLLVPEAFETRRPGLGRRVGRTALTSAAKRSAATMAGLAAKRAGRRFARASFLGA